MTKNRSYSYKDVDMLTASRTIAGSFKADISELSTVRTDWTEQYADELIVKIDTAIENYLGIDAKKDLRDATSSVNIIQAPAQRDLSFFKTQIDDDFKKEPAKKEEILKNLGFSKNLKAVQKGDQEALVQLLYAFKTNMTAALRAEITDKGLNPLLIDHINGYADTFNQANVTQESYKAATKEITKEAVDAFNAVYDEIIGICKKAANYYRYEPLKKEQFVFAKVVARLNAAKK